MKTDELREKYLDFFKSKQHTVCPSDVMVPKWDKTVLFTPAGMNQFKDHFLGKVELEFTRATTSQKCLRTGDIENVGRTAYHHTFFEMLGNFSFGDYFKRDAIHWAWEFLTDKKWLGLEKERLSVSVYLDDDEASDIWHKEIGLPLDRIARLDEHENFWPAGAPSLGPDGVCGPCSEIFYHPDNGPECEIWNLVFTQFNRNGDPPNNLSPLPSKNIDTGMGLERTAATLQGVSTNFHIDTLMPIVQASAEVCGIKYDPDTDTGRRLRRITDHIRACSLAIHENVYPGKQKEESVVRLLLRRAVLQGYEMGLRDPFLYKLVPAVVDQLERPYPELRETIDRVASVVKTEEEGFYGVIDRAIPRVDKLVQEAVAAGSKKLDATKVAIAYQTYGVPPTIAEAVAEQNGLEFNWHEFAEVMREHGYISNTGEKAVMGDAGPLDDIKREVKSTEFLGYESVEANADVCGLLYETVEHVKDDDGKEKQNVVQTRATTLEPSKQNQLVVMKRTPFYSEAGGQIGDTGVLVGPSGKFQVTDTQKTGDVVVHHGHQIEGSLSEGDAVVATVDSNRRDGIRRAHTATHILHYELQKILGKHAQQKGSKVSEDHLRFDFTNQDAVTEEQLQTIEAQTLERIEESADVTARTLPLDEARELGAMMLFGEKYPDPVRMVSIGDFSKELCGGIHLNCSNEVVAFEIISEENMGAGTRRIQALTGEPAKKYQEDMRHSAERIAGLLAVANADIPQAVASLSQHVKELKKQLSSGKEAPPAKAIDSSSDGGDLTYHQIRSLIREAAQGLNVAVTEVANRVESMVADVQSLQEQIEKVKAAGEIDIDQLVDSAKLIGEVRVIAQELPGANPGLMVRLIDQVRKKFNSIAILFATSPKEDKVLLSAGISRDLVDQGFHAGHWVGAVAPVVDGRGGGKPDLAQAGGKNPEKIAEAMNAAIDFIESKQSS